MIINTYEVSFSIFGADVQPQWRRAITSSVRVQATSKEDAIRVAGYGDATFGVGQITFNEDKIVSDTVLENVDRIGHNVRVINYADGSTTVTEV